MMMLLLFGQPKIKKEQSSTRIVSIYTINVSANSCFASCWIRNDWETVAICTDERWALLGAHKLHPHQIECAIEIKINNTENLYFWLIATLHFFFFRFLCARHWIDAVVCDVMFTEMKIYFYYEWERIINSRIDVNFWMLPMINMERRCFMNNFYNKHWTTLSRVCVNERHITHMHSPNNWTCFNLFFESRTKCLAGRSLSTATHQFEMCERLYSFRSQINQRKPQTLCFVFRFNWFSFLKLKKKINKAGKFYDAMGSAKNELETCSWIWFPLSRWMLLMERIISY